LEQVGSRAQLVAVPAAPGAWSRMSVLVQAWRVARELEVDTSWRKLAARLRIDPNHTGSGYGAPTPSGTDALARAESVGLTLEPTYTAKAFASALQHTASSPGATLYWHTLSAHPLAPLLESPTNITPLPAALRALLR
jgi:hypothetical protein